MAVSGCKLVKDSKEPSKKSRKSRKMDPNAELKCPLCLETLEADDVNFFPCKCEYQVCRFCWHRIRTTNENGLCPACRRQYPEDPANFKPLTQEELQKIKNQKKLKDQQKKQKITENRKQLADLRIIQKNLVFVHGLPAGIKSDYLKQEKFIDPYKTFGKIVKSIYNERANNTGTQMLSCAYITYEKVESALKVLKSHLANMKFEGREVKSSLGTTKYCSNYLKNVHCPKTDCMYLHELAEDEACFTKEDIKAGKHIDYGEKLYHQMISAHQKYAQCSQLTEQSSPAQSENSNSDLEQVTHQEYQCNTYKESNHSPLHDSSSQPLYNRHSKHFIHYPNNDFECVQDPSSSLDFRMSTPNSDHYMQETLSEHSPSGNIHMNGINGDMKDLHLDNGSLNDGWQSIISKAIGPSSSLYSNHSHEIPNSHRLSNGISSLFNSDQNLSPLIKGLSSIYSSSNSAPSHNETHQNHDDDLGFDPCQLSLEGLKDLISSEAKDITRSAGDELSASPFSTGTRPQSLHSLFQRNLQQQRAPSNPPPGFSAANFNNNSPLTSPASFERNSLSHRISPVDLLNPCFTPSPRQNCQTSPRFQPASSMQAITSVLNGSQASLRNLPLRQLFDQKTRLPQNPRLIRGMKIFGNFSPNNFSSAEQNTSPHWNMAQQQWKPTENMFQNQSISDYGPTSPISLRMQQLRSNELPRQVQLPAKYNNFSFSDNPQTLFPNLLNQDSKGIHSFP